MSADIERSLNSLDRPDIEQLMEYRNLMADIVRAQGRGIRYARFGEQASTRVGTEYMLPGAMTDWSIPDKKFRTYTERERRYSSSFRPMGERAGRLIVLESDSVLINPTTYGTKRNIYRFSWDSFVGLYEAEVMPVEIISSAQVDGVMLQQQAAQGFKNMLALDQEQTAAVSADDDIEYQRYINPFSDSPWELVSQSEFDRLLYRTGEFAHDLVGDIDGSDVAS